MLKVQPLSFPLPQDAEKRKICVTLLSFPPKVNDSTNTTIPFERLPTDGILLLCPGARPSFAGQHVFLILHPFPTTQLTVLSCVYIKPLISCDPTTHTPLIAALAVFGASTA